jgi:hypothetical protein
MTGLSVGEYQSLMMALSWCALILLMLAFVFAYGRVYVVFLPFFVSIGIGYGLLTMGQSIAHAPEFIVGLLLLSIYCVGKVQYFSLRARAIFYSFLGGVCVYFDTLDSTVVLIAILLCCQLSAPSAAQVLKPCETHGAPSHTALAWEIVTNSSLILIGGCIAIAVRVLGYSIISHINILEVAAAWTSALSLRVSGSLVGEMGINAKPNLHLALRELMYVRQWPFQGFLGKSAADGFYVLGFAAWATAMPLFCVSPTAVTIGIVMAAALVPAWFLILEQHTIVHAWMTGRIVPLFCGLGISIVVLFGWALARTYALRGLEVNGLSGLTHASTRNFPRPLRISQKPGRFDVC